eukprot:CAMPEP_0173194942 /NCGR_PEP_ID=MMETSP1141-20130122/14780_1 /TAXON_ID=483371 /ORGANISM="non described non described, Strain CCMP2298" /LENGTH=67 /DNA_ID=CAMNT_0014119417 /DNA_START=349 /DNA_END=552 /DNA_ORIENTATION=+
MDAVERSEMTVIQVLSGEAQSSTVTMSPMIPTVSKLPSNARYQLQATRQMTAAINPAVVRVIVEYFR